MSESPQPETTSHLPILLGAIGVLVVVLVLVGILFPLILKNSPLGEVVYEAQINEAFKTMTKMNDALVDILENAEAESFADLFADPDTLYAGTLLDTIDIHSGIAAALLSEDGRATLGLREGIAEKLPQTFFEKIEDPWGGTYRFYLGPWNPARHDNVAEPPFLAYIDYKFTPVLDGIAPTGNEKVFIYTRGRDNVSSQPFALTGNDTIAGDDVGSWIPAPPKESEPE